MLKSYKYLIPHKLLIHLDISPILNQIQEYICQNVNELAMSKIIPSICWFTVIDDRNFPQKIDEHMLRGSKELAKLIQFLQV